MQCAKRASHLTQNIQQRIYCCQKRGGQQVILKAFSVSDPNLEHEYRMLRLLHGHPNLFVQLHTAVCFGSARLALEMEYIHDAATPFYPQSDVELQCYMHSLLNVRLWLSLGMLTCRSGITCFAR